jgi:hypothetical protein
VIHDETSTRTIKQNTEERGKGNAKREDPSPSLKEPKVGCKSLAKEQIMF